MLSRMFNRNQRGRVGGTRRRREAKDVELERERQETEAKSQLEQSRRKGEVMKNAPVNDIRHNFASEEDSLEDKLMRHRTGSYFKYATIVTAPPPDRSRLLERMRNFKAVNDYQHRSLDDLPAIDLKGNYCEFQLSQALQTVGRQPLPPYTLVSEVLVHYVPMDTFFALQCPAVFQINDFRKVQDTVVREYELTDKGSYNILFCLDYSVRTEDVGDLVLSVACNQKLFREGIAWGTMKVVIRMTHLQFPIKANLQETIGVTLWAHSDLEDYISNPFKQSGLITGEALSELKKAFKRGDIEDLVTPSDNKRQLNAARTVVGESSRDVPVDSIMEIMKTKALAETKANLGTKGGNKTNPLAKGREMMANDKEEEEESDQGMEDDISPDDSFSNAGSTKQKKVARFANVAPIEIHDTRPISPESAEKEYVSPMVQASYHEI